MKGVVASSLPIHVQDEEWYNGERDFQRRREDSRWVFTAGPILCVPYDHV